MADAKLLSREDNKAEIEITVPAERIDSALQSIYSRIANSQKIAGFRKGKVPRHILNSMFGLESLHAQLLQELLPEIYSDAIQELTIIPTDSPEFDPWPTVEEGKDMIVCAKVEVLPEFEVADYSQFDLDMSEKVEPGDGEIEETILNMRKKKATHEEVAARPAQENDRVTLDYKLTIVDIAGKEPDTVFDEAQDVSIHLGDQEILPEIEEKITGSNCDEEKDFVVKYPDNYQNTELAGKNIKVEIKIKKIEERKLPEIDAEFLKSLGRYKTEEELRKGVERNITAYKRQIRDEALRNRVMSMILEKTNLEIPQKLVDDEVETRMEKLRNMIEQNPDGPSFEEVLAAKDLTEEKLRQDEEQVAKANLKKQFIFNEIFVRESMEITAEELSMALAQYAGQNGLNKSQIKKIAKDRDFMDEVRTQLKDSKVSNFLASRARFKEQWENQTAPDAETQAPDEETAQDTSAKEGEDKE
jgi:trigger factor